MRKNVKKWICLLVLLAAMTVNGTVLVNAEGARVFDQAGLFAPEEVQQLETEITALEERIQYDVVVVTADDAGGKSAMEYADDFYDENGFGTGTEKSGVLLLIDMDNRELWISTSGDMIDILTDARIDSILDDVYEGMADENYVKAAENFLEKTEYFVEQGVEAGQYRYDTEKDKLSLAEAIVIGVLAGALISGITCLIIVSRYKGKRAGNDTAYRQNADMHIVRKEDTFLNSVVTHRKIPKDPPKSSGGSSAGRSSTHTSSSGASHGGGGRKF